MSDILPLNETISSLSTTYGVCKFLESDLGKRLLGPTADYYGEKLKLANEYVVRNVGRILANSLKMIGDKLDEDESIAPRIVKKVMDEAVTCNDNIMAQYLAGVLAGSRNDISRDDRGNTFVELVGRLSSYQVRAHYVFYHITKNIFDGTLLEIGVQDSRRKMGVFLPTNVFVTAMAFNEEETKIDNGYNIGTHIIWGLTRESLIGYDLAFGDIEALKPLYPKAKEEGIVFYPTMLGLELFYWAYGTPDLSHLDFLNPGISFKLLKDVVLLPGYRSIE